MSEGVSRRIYYLAAVGIVAIVLISAIATTRPFIVQTGNSAAQAKTLQVTGEGTVYANPDVAMLQLAVQTQAVTANQASNDNAATMVKVMDALAGVGIAKTSIQTTSYSLTPVYNYKQDQSAPPTVVGYVARNAIQVTLTDFGLVGKTLDTAVAAGVNEVQGVVFTLSPSSYAKIEKQALQVAIQDAHDKATGMASTLGVTLLGPVSVTAGYNFQPMSQQLTASAAAQTPIQPGSLQVTANVQIAYEIA